MSQPPILSENDVRALASEQSFVRGADYYCHGAVFNTRRVGDELSSHCRGSGYTAYRVCVQLIPGGVAAAYCTCPYDWGGICKHVVALLLAWVHAPDTFEYAAPIDERLAGKSHAELIALIQEMLRREPDLERLLDLPLQPDPEAPLDLDAFRRQIDFLLQDDFPDPQELALELGAIAETADRFAAQGKWSAAGAIYHLLLGEIVPIYDKLYDEDGDISSVLQECAQNLQDCLVEGSPDNATRRSWFEVLLEAEFKDIEMGGIDLAYPAGETLIEYATDEEWEWIEKRVRQKIASMADRSSPWAQETLVDFLARRLASTQREADFSDLVFELGSPKQQAFELVRQERFAEAITVATGHFVDLPGLVLRFADALAEAGRIVEAAAYVTSLLETRSRTSYLDWLARLAERQADTKGALQWWTTLLRESPTLNVYQELRKAARQLEEWDALRPDLIRGLEARQQWDLLIEIALEEGDVCRALDLLPRQRWARHDLRVAQAAESSHPQAALEIYTRQAERLINARGRGNYQEAANILQRAKALYQRLDAQAGWELFFTQLRAQHARLPALQDELNKAGL